MRALVTGGSGFLGKFIHAELAKCWDVITVSRGQATLKFDLTKEVPLLPQIDMVVHSAGKAHVLPKSSIEIGEFHDVNVTGTENLLRALEQMPQLPKYFIFISSVAVYGCELGLMINEEHPLKAKDPYGVSKVQAEILIENWCLRNKVACSILRLPLIVGSNPPGNLGAMIRGIKKGYYFNIDGGKARKSMVMAEDVARLIPKVAQVGGVYNLTDRYHPSFFELSNLIASQLGKRRPVSMPFNIVNAIGKFGNLFKERSPLTTEKVTKMTADLTFDDSKAFNLLSWNPTKVLDKFRIF